MLQHVKDRPLTLIRFPDGIDKQQFYSKSRPDWTPDWIKSYPILHSEETVKYLVAKDDAAIVYLANLAALELHPMQMVTKTIDTPDHFIFDLDPPEDGDFTDVKDIALKLKAFLISYGYNPFVKTSGSKGLHIYVPIMLNHTHEEMVDRVKKMAKQFVEAHKMIATLELSKAKRGGKILIDIYRNHMAHTTVAPYSLRGKPQAPISFPLPWSALDDIHSSKEIHIRNYETWLSNHGNAWEDFYQSAVPLHDKAQSLTVSPEIENKLKAYLGKRDFNNTPEPAISPVRSSGQQFCIQLHDASNLHYDLRLEKDGVLLSWAIPKGFPHRKGIKRMAIQTEPHPMQYLTFEGVIPKGQYGAGNMWVWVKGTFIWIEETEKKIMFKLDAEGFNRTYKMYRTKDSQWILELKENHRPNPINLPVSPMLAGVTKHLPSNDKYVYEVKWDGIRGIIHLLDDEIKIYSRSGREITKQFPELQDASFFGIESGVFDGEIVCLDEEGRPLFSNVISRMHTQGEAAIQNVMKKYPVVCYLYDCLSYDGRVITREPLHRRQAWIKAALKKQEAYRLSEAITDGKGLFEATKQMGLEGIMAKDKYATYAIGQRTDYWLKIKHRSQEVCYIAGYTAGEGDRTRLFGALHLLKEEASGDMKYMGKVGTGFDEAMLKSLLAQFQPHLVDRKAFAEKTDDDHVSVWMNPILQCHIEFASLASSGVYREPVFKGLVGEV